MSRQIVLVASGVAVLSAAAFGLLAMAVVIRAPWLMSFDAQGLQVAMSWRSPGLTAFMRGVTIFGSAAVYALVLAAGIPVWRQRGVKYVLVAVVSLVLAQLVRLAVNLLVHRVRPPRSEWLTQATFYSFPSGHTLVAAVGLGLAAWLIWLVDRSAGIAAGVVAAGLCGLVGVSRVYLGVHWPSDVAGSLLFAGAWLGLTWLVVLRLGLV